MATKPSKPAHKIEMTKLPKSAEGLRCALAYDMPAIGLMKGRTGTIHRIGDEGESEVYVSIDTDDVFPPGYDGDPNEPVHGFYGPSSAVAVPSLNWYPSEAA